MAFTKLLLKEELENVYKDLPGALKHHKKTQSGEEEIARDAIVTAMQKVIEKQAATYNQENAAFKKKVLTLHEEGKKMKGQIDTLLKEKKTNLGTEELNKVKTNVAQLMQNAEEVKQLMHEAVNHLQWRGNGAAQPGWADEEKGLGKERCTQLNKFYVESRTKGFNDYTEVSTNQVTKIQEWALRGEQYLKIVDNIQQKAALDAQAVMKDLQADLEKLTKQAGEVPSAGTLEGYLTTFKNHAKTPCTKDYIKLAEKTILEAEQNLKAWKSTIKTSNLIADTAKKKAAAHSKKKGIESVMKDIEKKAKEIQKKFEPFQQMVPKVRQEFDKVKSTVK